MRERGYTSKRLAEEVGYSRTAIDKLKRTEFRYPNPDVLSKVCACLGLDYEKARQLCAVSSIAVELSTLTNRPMEEYLEAIGRVSPL